MKFLRKLIFYGLFVFSPGILFSQSSPFYPSNWAVTYSDNFDYGHRNAEWEPLVGDSCPWGIQTFSSSSKYISGNGESGRSFLELKAYVENLGGILKNVSGGLVIPAKVWVSSTDHCTNADNPFFYGYYEIEARLTKGNQSMNNVGLWPAFWFAHGETIGQDCNTTTKYWYEEVDIFEPGACQVKDNMTAFHYWTIDDDNFPKTDDNIWDHPDHEYFFYDVDMFNWHRWGVEWLPDRLTFYYDGLPIHTCSARVPSHQKPSMYIDLQIQDGGCTSPRTAPNTFIGSLQVNYFRYYALQACSGSITEASGNGYNFSNWSNALSNVKDYCIFMNTSVASSSNIVIRASDYVEHKGDFTVPLGAEFEITPKPCN